MSAGRDLGAVRTMKTSGREILYDIVENDHPGPPYYAQVSDFNRTDDLGADRQRTDLVLPYGKSSVILTRDLAINISESASAEKRTAGAPPPSWDTQNPLQALRLAVAASDLALQPDVVLHEAKQHVVSFHNGRYRVRILIDADTGLPTESEALIAFDRPASSSVVAWNAWGDILERTEYENWTIADGLRFPFQWDVYRNGEHFRTVVIGEAHIDAPVDQAALTPLSTDVASDLRIDDLPLGQAVASAPAANKPIAEIAPGVVQIPNSWFVTLVRQTDGVVVIDAPISAGYSKRVLTEAARRFPGLPVKAVIASTGFFWHIAGVREYAARGIPIYTEQRNAEVIRRLLAAPHTLVPDDLSRTRIRAPTVIAVASRTQIGTGPNAITLLPIRRATEPMLMTYIRDQRLLHTGEMVQPLGPGGAFLYPEALLELTHTVDGDALDVDRIIGMHMSPTPWSKVSDTLRAAGARP